MAPVLPALGAPRVGRCDHRRPGRRAACPLQVIIVLAAQPAVAIDGPTPSRPRRRRSSWTCGRVPRRWASVVNVAGARGVNALNAVSGVRPDQLAEIQAAPEVAGVYPVRRLCPGGDGRQGPAALGADARPIAPACGDGKGVGWRCSSAPSTARTRICRPRARLERDRRQARGGIRRRWPRPSGPRWPASSSGRGGPRAPASPAAGSCRSMLEMQPGASAAPPRRCWPASTARSTRTERATSPTTRT